MRITCFEDLVAQAKKMTEKAVIAVVEAQDEHTLESVIKAAADGIAVPILIGNVDEIIPLLSRFGAVPSDFQLIASGGIDESLVKAVELIHSARATVIMKGRLDTAQFMNAIVAKENGLIPAGGKLSLIGFYETPKYHKIFAVSDFGINTYPDLDGKKIITENAVRFLHAIGYLSPKVAVLSSVEKVNPKMIDTVDGDALKRMNLSGEITGCTIEGPISFDLAMSIDAAKIKGYLSPVAGDADLLIVPDIVSGNILVKCLTMFGGSQTAGTVIGARVPIVLTSRSAEAADKYYSIALAACAAARF